MNFNVEIDGTRIIVTPTENGALNSFEDVRRSVESKDKVLLIEEVIVNDGGVLCFIPDGVKKLNNVSTFSEFCPQELRDKERGKINKIKELETKKNKLKIEESEKSRALQVSKRRSAWSSYSSLLSEYVDSLIGVNTEPAGKPKPVTLLSVSDDFFTVGDHDSGVFVHIPYKRIVLIEEVEEGKELKMYFSSVGTAKIMVHIDYPVVYKGFIGFGMGV